MWCAKTNRIAIDYSTGETRPIHNILESNEPVLGCTFAYFIEGTYSDVVLDRCWAINRWGHVALPHSRREYKFYCLVDKIHSKEGGYLSELIDYHLEEKRIFHSVRAFPADITVYYAGFGVVGTRSKKYVDNVAFHSLFDYVMKEGLPESRTLNMYAFGDERCEIVFRPEVDLFLTKARALRK